LLLWQQKTFSNILKLLIWKGYHGLLHIYMPYKQNATFGDTNIWSGPWTSSSIGLIGSLLARERNKSG